MQTLIEQAKLAIQHSYAPYSQFRVAAAVLADNGEVFTGVNVENASYGLTQCAERTAICSAVASGASKILQVVIYTPTMEPTPPCGACRQVMQEFGPNTEILAICDSQQRLETTLNQLLPYSFSDKQINET